jgi:predicted nucleic acid-binding protein
MTWLVDTCVLLDLLVNDPQFGLSSATCLNRLLPQGLAISSTTYIELAPAFRGDAELMATFLAQVGIASPASPKWLPTDTTNAFSAWHRQVSARRASGGSEPRRPVADLLIATVACRHAGIVTRNPRDFRAFYPDLTIVDPCDAATWPG